MDVRFDRILFPTDFSELALAPLPYVKKLIEVFHAELHCLHVVDEAYQYWSALGPESLPVGPPPEELLNLARTRIEQFRAAHLADVKRPLIAEVALGRPYAEIIRYARERNIDLIVMGTHGRGAIAQMLLGSTADKVLHKAPCPVLTIRGQLPGAANP